MHRSAAEQRRTLVRPPKAPWTELQAGSRQGGTCRRCPLAPTAAVAWLVVTLVVQKYGGTSVGDADRIRAVADHIARTRRAGTDVIVVVSAMGKTTDGLIRLAEDVSRVRPGRELDMLLTAGERISMALAVHGARGARRCRRLVHRQPGWHHHRHDPHEGADPRGEG